MDYKAIALKIVEAELDKANFDYSVAKSAFQGFSKKDMSKKFGDSEKTCTGILQEAGNRVDEVAGTYYWITQQD